jgi:hypothetical protein
LSGTHCRNRHQCQFSVYSRCRLTIAVDKHCGASRTRSHRAKLARDRRYGTWSIADFWKLSTVEFPLRWFLFVVLYSSFKTRFDLSSCPSVPRGKGKKKETRRHPQRSGQ